MIKNSDIVLMIRNSVKASSPNATVILYGSQARGDFMENSDIDILILLDKKRITREEEKRIKYPLYDIEIETGKIISPLVLSKNDWESKHKITPFYDNVLREGIVLWQTKERKDIVDYRISRAKDTRKEVDLHVSNELWSTAVNRLYYACYYAVIALLVSKEIGAQTHAGVRQMFGLHFIKPGLIDKELGKFYSDIFDKRQTGDYDDFVNFTKEEVISMITPAKNLIDSIEKLLVWFESWNLPAPSAGGEFTINYIRWRRINYTK